MSHTREVHLSDRADAVVGRVLSLKTVGGLLTVAITLGGILAGALLQLGFRRITPGDRLASHEAIMAANRAYTDTVREEVTGLERLVGSTTIKTCLDAEPSAGERLKLAQAGVPCDSLYRQRGLRP